MLPQAGGAIAFVIPVWKKAFVKEFVGQYASLRKAPHSSAHFKVDKTIECMLGEVVLVDCPLREQHKGDLRVLESVQRGS